jgi:hypothetical protein
LNVVDAESRRVYSRYEKKRSQMLSLFAMAAAVGTEGFAISTSVVPATVGVENFIPASDPGCW